MDEPLENSIAVDLKITPRVGGYARGQEGLEQILRAALDILIDDGSKALTFRNIAARCGLKAGNLAYYFPAKEDLLRDLLNAIVSGYEEAFAGIAHEADGSPSERLGHLIGFILSDITTKRTTRVFPELWAMANHDRYVQDRVEELYVRARASIEELIGEINPALQADERALAALFISASLEGTTVFAGHDKPWRKEMPAIEFLAIRSFVGLIETLQPGEIRTRLSSQLKTS